MWFLYLDESGDLGCDFDEKNPSSYFTVSILLIKGVQNNRALINAVKKTLRRKLNTKKKRRRIVTEIKAHKTSIEIKTYFFEQISKMRLEIYSVTLDKRQVSEQLISDKNRVYNFVSRMAIEKIPFDDTIKQLELIIDKSKNKLQILEFNTYLINQLEAMLDPRIPIHIYHRNSENDYGLQAADLFCWGIFRKYERMDGEWFEIFKQKVSYDEVYP